MEEHFPNLIIIIYSVDKHKIYILDNESAVDAALFWTCPQSSLPNVALPH